MMKIAKDFDEDIDNPDKKHPLDVTLWRARETNQAPHIPSFASPFGKGRPGWHIECSSMAISTLGSQIDIHGGGIDLIYPHHEAEIAQSEGATGKIPFSRFWLHVSPVFYKGEKISKSLGNLIMVSDLLKKYSPDVIRWYLISHHYRESFEYKEKEVEKTESLLNNIREYVKKGNISGAHDGFYWNKFLEVLRDDINTTEALKLIAEMVDKKISSQTISKCLSLLGFTLA